MSAGNVEVSRSKPCPICGKTDYCSFWTDSIGNEQIICKRSSTQQDVVGKDGRVYKFLRLTQKGQFTAYQDKEIYEAVRAKEKDDWMRANQKGPYNPRWQRFSSRFKKKKEEKQEKALSPIVLPEPIKNEIVDWIEPLSHEKLDTIYRAMLSFLTLDDIHHEYLKKEGWDDDLIARNMIRSFPEKDFLRMKYKNFYSKNLYRKKLAQKIMDALYIDDLVGVPGAYIDQGGNWTFNGPKGILFPIYDADGYIYGLRIRMDFMDAAIPLKQDHMGRSYYEHDGKRYFLKPLKGWFTFQSGEEVFLDKNGYWTDYNGSYSFREVNGKYRPLTSYFEDEKELKNHRSVNIYKGGCRLPMGTSLYFNPKEDDPTICYVTEGEKKGIYGNAMMHSPVITFPGVDSWSDLFTGNKGERLVDKLKAAGVMLFVVVYDADKTVNERVLSAQEHVLNALQSEGFAVGIGNWDMHLGKGLDDLLSKGFQPSYVLI